MMHILVQFPDPAERAALCGLLQTWAELSCVLVDIQAAPEPGRACPDVVFWDLDKPGLPPESPEQDCALFLCSREPQRAIGSYSFHPAGFLTKPFSMKALWNAMLRCAPLWFGSLQRLEILSGRLRISIPFQNLLWAEGNRRGCLLHTSHQSLSAREPLYQLEQRLPPAIFARCQRSFVVNLLHVQEITSNSIFLKDGTEISLGRSNKAVVADAYRRFLRLRYGG